MRHCEGTRQHIHQQSRRDAPRTSERDQEAYRCFAQPWHRGPCGVARVKHHPWRPAGYPVVDERSAPSVRLVAPTTLCVTRSFGCGLRPPQSHLKTRLPSRRRAQSGESPRPRSLVQPGDRLVTVANALPGAGRVAGLPEPRGTHRPAPPPASATPRPLRPEEYVDRLLQRRPAFTPQTGEPFPPR